MINLHRNPELSVFFLIELNISKKCFGFVLNEWSKLDPSICQSSGSCDIFWDAFLKFIIPIGKKIVNINDTFVIKMLADFALGTCLRIQ